MSAGHGTHNTAFFSYTPASLIGEPLDPQTVQAALGAVIHHLRRAADDRRSADPSENTRAVKDGSGPSHTTARWFAQVRTLRLSLPAGPVAAPRSLYLVRDIASPEAVTLVIEDPASSAVNISTLASSQFDFFLSTVLLPPTGSHGTHPAGSQVPASDGAVPDGSTGMRAMALRWLPRPSYAQLEGIIIDDLTSDFKICVGMLSLRGGASGGNPSVSPSLCLQVEYTPQTKVPFGRGNALAEYLDSALPSGGLLTEVTQDIHHEDWINLLGVSRPAGQLGSLPGWNARNSSWCLVKMCKASRLL